MKGTRSMTTMQVQLMFFFLYTAAILQGVDAFVPPTVIPVSSRAAAPPVVVVSDDASALFGVRSAIRRRLSSSRIANRFFQKIEPIVNETPNSESTAAVHHYYGPPGTTTGTNTHAANDGVAPATTSATTTPFASYDQESQATMMATATLQRVQSDEQQEEEQKVVVRKVPQPHLDVMPATTESAILTRAKTAASTSHISLYSVPMLNRNLTKLEKEFREMIEHFANYSEADLLSIADPRKRALFEGVAASAYSQPIYRAFEVLFEDLLPLRLAGRLIYAKLKQFMTASVEERKADVQRVIDQTGLTEDIRQIEEIRLMFVSTASQLNGESYLTLDQLAETGIITGTATEVLGFESAEQLLNQLDTAKTGRLTFIDLMSGLWDCATELCGIENCNPHAVLHNLLVELNERPPPPADINARLDASRRKFGARYDEMVSSFIQWQHLLPPPPADGSPEGRRMDVVRGCFVGAENQKVVDALRIVYVDYAGLRVAGDIIFKLVSSLLNRR